MKHRQIHVRSYIDPKNMTKADSETFISAYEKSDDAIPTSPENGILYLQDKKDRRIILKMYSESYIKINGRGVIAEVYTYIQLLSAYRPEYVDHHRDHERKLMNHGTLFYDNELCYYLTTNTPDNVDSLYTSIVEKNDSLYEHESSVSNYIADIYFHLNMALDKLKLRCPGFEHNNLHPGNIFIVHSLDKQHVVDVYISDFLHSTCTFLNAQIGPPLQQVPSDGGDDMDDGKTKLKTFLHVCYNSWRWSASASASASALTSFYHKKKTNSRNRHPDTERSQMIFSGLNALEKRLRSRMHALQKGLGSRIHARRKGVGSSIRHFSLRAKSLGKYFNPHSSSSNSETTGGGGGTSRYPLHRLRRKKVNPTHRKTKKKAIHRRNP